MKKCIVFVLLALIISPLTYAQSVKGNGNIIKKEFPVSKIENISNFCSANLFISQSDADKLTVEIDENLIQYFKYDAGKNNIEINLNGRNIGATTFNVYLNVTDLKGLENTGSGDIRTLNTIKSDDFVFDNTGSGDCSINIRSKTFNADITGSGNANVYTNANICKLDHTGSGDLELNNENNGSHLTLNNTGSGNSNVIFNGSNFELSNKGSGETKLKGQTVNFVINSLGSGGTNGEEFIAENCTVKMLGSGDIEFKCNKTADIEILGSGDLKLSGNYKINNISTTGSGKLIR